MLGILVFLVYNKLIIRGIYARKSKANGAICSHSILQ